MLDFLGLYYADATIGILAYLALPLPFVILDGIYFRPAGGRRRGLARPGYLKMLQVMLRPERFGDWMAHRAQAKVSAHSSLLRSARR